GTEGAIRARASALSTTSSGWTAPITNSSRPAAAAAPALARAILWGSPIARPMARASSGSRACTSSSGQEPIVRADSREGASAHESPAPVQAPQRQQAQHHRSGTHCQSPRHVPSVVDGLDAVAGAGDTPGGVSDPTVVLIVGDEAGPGVVEAAAHALAPWQVQ